MHSRKSDNSLYCTNRTSLESSSYATGASIYTRGVEATGSLWNVTETCRRRWKAIEGNRRLWNLMEVSGKRENVPQVSYVIDGESGPERNQKEERENQVRRRQSVTLPYKLLTHAFPSITTHYCTCQIDDQVEHVYKDLLESPNSPDLVLSS